ncbi:MAG: UDP-4-amino-4,6-dideoxy-N-acetyl-beta-L-altrosamine N-acetyltransferase [Epsilonproteobacteria bacterium]|nr:UDP-4-amino-4,6-dideoxy-N-acetyl-beta-L-altrosamine N-acetyltransferase [Campylobacterota bacterium]
MKDIILTNFRDLSFDEKIMVLGWRNHPNIKKWMYTQEDISLENHLKFIDSLKSNKDKLYFLLKESGEYIGVIDFYNFKDNSCDIGLYQNPNLKGRGQNIMNTICKYAFGCLKLKSIFAEVILSNAKAYDLYHQFGFKIVKELNVKKHNIYRMELINENWKF